MSGAQACLAHGSDASGHAKCIAAATSLALRLAEASKRPDKVASIRAKTLMKSQRVGAPVRKGEKAEDLEELQQCVVTRHERDWRAARAQWVHDVNNKVPQTGIVPNPKKCEVPNVVHRRCVVEW